MMYDSSDVDDVSSSVGGGVRSTRGQRAAVLELEDGGGSVGGAALSSGGEAAEESDRVAEILRTGGMMSAQGPERRKSVQAIHTHTLSAPTALNAFPSAAADIDDTTAIAPPPDKSGWLYKRGNLNSSWKKRWFVLRYQTLKYYKNSGDSKSKGFISLSAAQLVPGTSDKMRRLFGFEISSMKYSRVFVIHADSEGEMHEWMDCLQRNIDYVSLVIEREKRQNAGAQLSLNTAVIPDKTALNFGMPKKVSSSDHQLSLDLTEEYLKATGVPSRMSGWRREVPRIGFEDQTAKLVTTSSLRSSDRMYASSCFAVHNVHNAVAIGLGSTHPDDRSSGVVQIVNVDTRGSVSQLTESGRFAGDLAERAEKQRTVSITRKGSFAGAGEDAQSASMTIPCGGEATALEWTDEKLFVGSSGGVVAMYQVPDATPASVSAAIQPVQLLHHDKVSTIPLSAPGKWLHTSRIGRVALNPVDKKSLLTLANHYFFVWDIDRGATVASEIGSTNSAPIFACAWNPHQRAPEFMFGGEEGALRLLDARLLANSVSGGIDRSKCVSWFAPRAHADVIRDIAWSPLVPHWVASAGDDGLIKIWDTRFGTEPVRVLSGHTNSVFKVDWSKSHCEMLVSASVDATARMWNLRVAPHYTMYAHDSKLDDFSGPLVHAAFSPQQPFQILVGSTNGECAALHMQKELIANYVVQRSQPATAAPAAAAPTTTQQPVNPKPDADESDKKSGLIAPSPTVDVSDAPTAVAVRTAADELHEREIFTLLYLRDYDRAFKSVASLAQKYWQRGLYVFANQLLKLTGFTSFMPAALEPSKAPPGANTLKAFNSMLVDLSRFLPPNSIRLSSRDPITQQRIDFLKTRLVIVDRIQAGKYQDILALSGEICAHLERAAANNAASPSSATNTTGGGGASAASTPAPPLESMDQFDSVTLEQMARTILPCDHIRGLDFCIRIAKALKESGNFSLFIGIARVIFHPTIYERMEEGSTSFNQCSYVRTLSVLAHTPIGAPNHHHHHHHEESQSESESDVESSTNSISSSVTSTRKPSDADWARPNIKPPSAPRPSLSSPTGSPPPNAVTTTSRGSVTAGSELQHAQITLDRDLRNPKIVLAQLTLLAQMFQIIAADEDAAAAAAAAASTDDDADEPAPASPKSSSKKDAPTRFNPYLAKQSSSVASRLSLDTLGMPPLSSSSAKEIARLMEEHKEPHKLLPSIVHFLYFHSLILQKKYDLVFVAATKIGGHSVLKSYQFANVLEGVMNEITTPRFVKFLDRLLNRDQKSGGASSPVGSQLSKLQAASLTIINMLFNMDYLPQKLSTLLPRYLRDVHEEVRRSLTEVRNNPAYVPSTSYSTAKADCRAKADGILSQIQRIKTHSKIVGEPHCSEAVNEFVNMLKRFQEA